MRNIHEILVEPVEENVDRLERVAEELRKLHQNSEPKHACVIEIVDSMEDDVSYGTMVVRTPLKPEKLHKKLQELIHAYKEADEYHDSEGLGDLLEYVFGDNIEFVNTDCYVEF